MACYGGCGGHYGAYQVRAAVFALAALEIAIGGAGAALVRRQDVRVHSDAHAATGIAPLETGGRENFIEAFFFGLRFDAARAGHDQRLLYGAGHVLADYELRGGAEIVDAGVGAGTNEDAIDGNIHDGRAGFQAHVDQGALRRVLIIEVAEGVRVGHAGGDAGDHAGIGAPGDLRRDVFRVQLHGHVELGAVVAAQLFPALDRFLKGFAAGNERSPFEVRERGFVWRDHAGARAAFDGHVANCHAAVHGEAADGFAAIFGDVSGAAADADFADDGEDDVLGGDAGGALAIHDDVQRFGTRLREALRGEHVLDFAGADAEGERAKRAMRGSVAVAANDGLPGLRDAQLRADDVHDALLLAVQVKEAHAGFAAIFLERLELQARVGIDDGQRAVGGGDGVVHHRECKIGAADFASLGAQAREGLRGSAFVDEVAVNIDERGLAGLFVDNVGVPNFLVESFGDSHESSV